MTVIEKKRFFDWANYGHMPNVLRKLEKMALNEVWRYKNDQDDPKKPFPILHSYLKHTFERLVEENDKIRENLTKGIACYNTGLVDKHYQPIYAIFITNDIPDKQLWKFAEFCIAGEGRYGQAIVDAFQSLPERAHYFEDPVQLLYDIRRGKPSLAGKHVIIDNIDRFPKEFIIDELPRDYKHQELSKMTTENQKKYYDEMRQFLKNDDKTYKKILGRINNAIDLALLKISWNFKTAIPYYFPTTKKVALLLPMCLADEEVVDMALVVERTSSGNYLGHTILPLDVVYSNARLLCRPDSIWLSPDKIEVKDTAAFD